MTAPRPVSRVVNTRFGMILSPRGGALKKMLPPFELGVGGRSAAATQWMSWVTLADVWRRSAARSPTAPSAARQRDGPGVVPNARVREDARPRAAAAGGLPAARLRGAGVFGEVADALLLASQRCEPRRLAGAGFAFRRHADLEPALRSVLGLR